MFISLNNKIRDKTYNHVSLSGWLWNKTWYVSLLRVSFLDSLALGTLKPYVAPVVLLMMLLKPGFKAYSVVYVLWKRMELWLRQIFPDIRSFQNGARNILDLIISLLRTLGEIISLHHQLSIKELMKHVKGIASSRISYQLENICSIYAGAVWMMQRRNKYQ